MKFIKPRTLRPSLVVFALMLVVSVSFASTSENDASTWTRDDAAHLLRRAGFGGTPVQIDRLHDLGKVGAVDYLISGKLPAGAVAPFDHVDLEPFKTDGSIDLRQGPERQFEIMKLRAWWIDRMIRTDRPLEEKMSLFWHGLFTSGIRECKVPRWMVEQNELFHKQAIGNYERLTFQVIHGSAMLKYLNNDENIKGHPNENLARELMELFTMGEGNGYTEADIGQVARALTGLTPRRPQMGGNPVLIPMRHDAGIKTIFGHSGNYGPNDVVQLIFSRQYPADYLAKRLWVFFGTPDPQPQDIEMVAHALRSSGWEVAPALRAMFLSPDFYSSACKFTIIKSPIDLEVGTVRMLEEPSDQRLDFAVSVGARQLGQDLFQPPNVKGWPGGEHWITSAGIYTRYNIATAMANGIYGANAFNRPRDFNPKAQQKAAQKNLNAPNDASAQATTASAVINAAPDNSNNPKRANRREAKQEQAQQQRQKIMQELRDMPPMPAPNEMVQPAKLFAQFTGETESAKVVDAAISRFLQQPLAADKRQVLVDAIGNEPLTLGQPASDRRVRQMLGLLMSTPEYQME